MPSRASSRPEAYSADMDPERKMDLDEPVNVDMEPDDALRVLLGEQSRDEETAEDEASEAEDT